MAATPTRGRLAIASSVEVAENCAEVHKLCRLKSHLAVMRTKFSREKGRNLGQACVGVQVAML